MDPTLQQENLARRTRPIGLSLSAAWHRLRAWLTARVGERDRWLLSAELSLVVIWALWAGRRYLDFNPNIWPAGGEFPMVVHSHYIWSLLSRCGTCFFWNGFINGGYPAFAELHGAPLNPLVALPTLQFGVINGAKVTLVVSLAIAGLAQWWIAKQMGFGPVPRLWSAGIAVVGGHLAGKMENGGMTLIVSTAMASLAVAATLNLALSGRRRAAVALAGTLALLITSGQGYLQIAFGVAVVPTLLVLILDEKLRPRPVYREFLLAGGLGLLLSAYFLIPLMHFLPQLGKDVDPNFHAAQALQYVPLNLVLSDAEIYRQQVLTNQPWPYLYLNYIGWVPILLAFLAIRLTRRRRSRLLVFFLLALTLTFVSASALPFEALRNLFPQMADAVRNPSLMAGLAVPLVLALAAWGLDRLVRLDWPRLTWNADSDEPVSVSITWLVLFLPLVFALKSGFDFSQEWLGTYEPPPEVNAVTELMTPDETGWASPPVGEHFWNPAAIEAGMKITDRIVPWHWRERENPPSIVDGLRDYETFPVANMLGKEGGVTILTHKENSYAFVDTGFDRVPCEATSNGGHIRVSCASPAEGRLFVMENAWDGWRVERDGSVAALGTGRWLNTRAPGGEHTYTFRYQPWDVPVGLLLSLIGLWIAGWLWVRDGSKAAPSSG